VKKIKDTLEKVLVKIPIKQTNNG